MTESNLTLPQDAGNSFFKESPGPAQALYTAPRLVKAQIV